MTMKMYYFVSILTFQTLKYMLKDYIRVIIDPWLERNFLKVFKNRVSTTVGQTYCACAAIRSYYVNNSKLHYRFSTDVINI